MMVLDYPDSVFLYVQIGVTSLDLVSSGTHSEFIDTSVARPAVWRATHCARGDPHSCSATVMGTHVRAPLQSGEGGGMHRGHRWGADQRSKGVAPVPPPCRQTQSVALAHIMLVACGRHAMVATRAGSARAQRRMV